MKAKLCIWTVAIVLLFSSFEEVPIQKRQIDFDVKLGGTIVGSLQAIQLIDGDKITYNLSSKVEVDMLFTVGVDEKITDVFDYNRLTQSQHTRHVNKGMKAHNTLIWQGSNYMLKNKNNKSQKLLATISHTVLSIYFKEPQDGQKLYSHSFQEILALVKIGDGRYKVEIPNGNTTIFQYKQGKLQSVQSQTDWGTIRFDRKN